MGDVKVEEVERIGNDPVSVTIAAGSFSIRFSRRMGKVVKVAVRQWEINRANNIFVPPYLYKPALRVAYAILFPQPRKKKGKKKFPKKIFKF